MNIFFLCTHLLFFYFSGNRFTIKKNRVILLLVFVHLDFHVLSLLFISENNFDIYWCRQPEKTLFHPRPKKEKLVPSYHFGFFFCFTAMDIFEFILLFLKKRKIKGQIFWLAASSEFEPRSGSGFQLTSK